MIYQKIKGESNMNQNKVKCIIVIERVFSNAGNDLENMYIDFIAKKIAEMVNKKKSESLK